ncbi:hypothetical protein EVAR_37399_1 [Eumeta japonica]|uniref:Uncharacterized protein n=1 Tax=Eumeta variegata TaxID=151549 RepID=A0A4C1WHL1_EUMVA|nr:hypothetical protein EVAR_37399_1 [Eumeta japonica]
MPRSIFGSFSSRSRLGLVSFSSRSRLVLDLCSARADDLLGSNSAVSAVSRIVLFKYGEKREQKPRIYLWLNKMKAFSKPTGGIFGAKELQKNLLYPDIFTVAIRALFGFINREELRATSGEVAPTFYFFPRKLEKGSILSFAP